jgi:hypothetical protein
MSQAYLPDLPPFEAVAGWIGQGPALEYMDYATMASQLVSPDAVILNPETAQVPENPAALWAVTTALADRATAGNFSAISVYLGRVMPEYAVYCVKSALAGEKGNIERLGPEDKKRYKKLENSHAFVSFAIQYKDLLT